MRTRFLIDYALCIFFFILYSGELRSYDVIFWGVMFIMSVNNAMRFHRVGMTYLAFGQLIIGITAFSFGLFVIYKIKSPWLAGLFLTYFLMNYIERKKNPVIMDRYELVSEKITIREMWRYLEFINDKQDINKICLFCKFSKVSEFRRICTTDKKLRELDNTCEKFQANSGDTILIPALFFSLLPNALRYPPTASTKV